MTCTSRLLIFGFAKLPRGSGLKRAPIDRFGRYPHRNAILGRESTEEEIAFLKQPNSSF